MESRKYLWGNFVFLHYEPNAVPVWPTFAFV
jgi:hypothetical protein